MYSICPDTAEKEDQLYCMGIIYGFSQGVQVMGILKEGTFSLPCDPKTINHGQRRDIFVKHLKTYPEERHQMAFPLFVKAMRDAFPCPE